MMSAGQQQQAVAAQSFAARIAGMGLHGQLRLSQPTAQGFAINGKQTATFGQSDQGHQTTPFVLQVTRTTADQENSRECSWDKSRQFSPGRSGEGSRETSREPRAAVSGQAKPAQTRALRQSLTSFLTTPTMIVAGPILMGSSPPRPLTDQGGRGGSRKEQAGQQMTDFAGGQDNDSWSRHGHGGGRWRRTRTVLVHSDADQKSRGQHDEGQMAIPAEVAADFILIQSQVFAGLQVLLNAPAGPNGLHDGAERRGQGSKDQVIGQLLRIVQATAYDQEMAAVDVAALEPGQDGPVKEAFAFAAQALREWLPVLWAQGLLGDAGDRAEQASLLGLDTDDLDARHGQGVGIALRLEEGAQLRAVTVNGISHHPVDGQARRLGALEHALGQFRFGLEGDALGEMGGEAAGRIVAPVLWQVQLAIDEPVALGGDVGEEGAHLIAYPVVIPDGVRQQTLHAVGPQLFGMLSDLPAIFPGDVTDDGLQVAQGATAWLGAGKMRRQAGMQMKQAHGPGANLAQGGLGLLWCGIVMMLHAFLVSNGQLKQEVFVLLECHIGACMARSFFCSRENSRENGSLYKCLCSVTANSWHTLRV